MPESPENRPVEGLPKRSNLLEINIQTRFGSLRGNLPVPATGMRLAELAWNALNLDGRLIDMAIAAESKQGREVSCRKGCGACCRQAVPLAPAEAWMLYDLMASFPPDRRGRILERFASARERLQAAGFGDRSLDSSAQESEVLSLGLDYLRLGIPCPFLEEESCSIHAHRPSACREYLVTSPAANCSQPGELPIASVPLATSLTEGLSKLSARVLKTEPKVIPMILALEWAEDHRQEGQSKYDGTFLLASLIDLLNGSPPATAGAVPSAPEAPSC